MWMNNTKKICFLILALLLAGAVGAQNFLLTSSTDSLESRWVDSVFQAMSPDERLGQLFMIRAHSDLGAEHIAGVKAAIERYQVGGLCFFQGTPEKQIELLNSYQKLSGVPLLVGIDGEWGLGMRMKSSTISFPRQLTLGAIQNNRLLYEMGEEIARQMRRVGVTVNFAPVADINNNPENPVINTRSFGEDRYNVTVKSYMYMKGMQDHGLMASAKHFPGHGDTDVDSHNDLPVIPHDRLRLDSVELYPFQALSDYGIGSMMVAHLNMPALDDRKNRPTTLSKNTITGLLKEDINFKGLVFTDALEMKGVTKHFESGQVEAEALVAGNDMLLLPESLEASLREIKRYLADGRLLQSEIDARIRKILRAKYRLGLHHFRPIPVDGVRADLNTAEAKSLKRKLIREALTLVRNRDQMIPFVELDSLRLASLSIGAGGKPLFQKRLDAYASFHHLQAGKSPSKQEQARLVAQLKDRDAVVVSLHDMSQYASRNFGVTTAARHLIDELRRHTRVVLVVFGSPYSLRYFDDIDWVLEAYEENEITQDLAAQALFGAFAVRGRLPVTASPRSPYNAGVSTNPSFRMGFAPPEETGLNSDTLQEIDELARRAIELRATPGCVVLVAKNGQVIFERAYGYHTYRKERPVQVDDVYDLASLTKILASTLSVMKLKEEGRLDLDTPLSRYLPDLDGTNKGDLVLRDIMAHHAGLIGWIPFYKQTLAGSRRNPRPSPGFYHRYADEEYAIPVTERLYMRRDFADSIRVQIQRSKLRPTRGYKYSDLGFYLIAEVVKKLTGSPLNEYVDSVFYRPLGLPTATFLPWRRLPLEKVPPSEDDRYFRRQQVKGYVHDMGAAMLGGVSGHAGLFANAQDVATIMQMLLQGGYYGGRRYLQEATIREFTTRHPRSTRRGIGFDMFQMDHRFPANFSPLASKQTFGHTGFTGTCVWADPESELIYVFLSNRTFPSMSNYRLNKMEVRPRIQTLVYKAMEAEEAPEEPPLALPRHPEPVVLPGKETPGPVASGQD